jgi:hypothetical protein
MHTAPTTYDRRAIAVAILAAVLMAAIVCSAYLVHQSTLTVPVVPQTTVQPDVCPIGDDWSCALR